MQVLSKPRYRSKSERRRRREDATPMAVRRRPPWLYGDILIGTAVYYALVLLIASFLFGNLCLAPLSE